MNELEGRVAASTATPEQLLALVGILSEVPMWPLAGPFATEVYDEVLLLLEPWQQHGNFAYSMLRSGMQLAALVGSAVGPHDHKNRAPARMMSVITGGPQTYIHPPRNQFGSTAALELRGIRCAPWVLIGMRSGPRARQNIE